MRQFVLVGVIILLFVWAAALPSGRPRASAPGAQPPAQQPQPHAPAAPAPNAAGSVAGQGAAQTGVAVRPSLQCQGCHAPGQPLPYLGGEQFHKDSHTAYEAGHHAKAINGGRRAAACLDCHARGGDLSTMLPASDPASTVNRSQVALTCSRCHGDPAAMRGSGISAAPFLAYQESAHARAIARGNPSAAVCTDCHRGHDILPTSDPASSIAKANIPATCGKCHSGVAAEFTASVHGQSIARGNTQSPSCTDCHGIHSIKPRRDARQQLGTTSCEHCHEGVRLTQEFGVAPNRVTSYEDSYHGLAKRLGSEVAADCASCHGVHNILPSQDPRSMINEANLVQTCGQCHPGATANFASGAVHVGASPSADAASTGVRWVRFVYLPLIVLTVGGMALHNLLVWRRKAAERRRHESRPILRLTRNQRAQHWLLLTSFITLVVSGFALVYPDWWPAWVAGSSEHVRRVVHRVAAVVMIAVGLYHVAYLALTREGRQWVRDMLPTWKDASDLVQNFRHYLGGRVARPKIARFGYAEKAEYWAVIWGTIVMGWTGLLIWFKVGWFGWLPRWWVDVAIAVHFYEAVLATLAIVVWHFYHVIFDPEVYPVNWAFLDGRVSEEFYREEHGLDYERILKSQIIEREEER